MGGRVKVTVVPGRARSLDRHLTAVELNEPSRQQQTKAGPSLGAGQYDFNLAERLQRARDFLRVHADAGVGDRSRDLAEGLNRAETATFPRLE